MSSNQITLLFKEVKNNNYFSKDLSSKAEKPTHFAVKDNSLFINKKRIRGKGNLSFSTDTKGKKQKSQIAKRFRKSLRQKNPTTLSKYTQMSINHFLKKIPETSSPDSSILEEPPKISKRTFALVKKLNEKKEASQDLSENLKNYLDGKGKYSMRFKYEEFLNLNSRELILPVKYKLLLKTFQEFEQILNYFQRKDEGKISFLEIKEIYKDTFDKVVEKEEILKLLDIGKELYKVTNSANDEVFIEPKSNEIMLRENTFKYRLLQIVNRNHILFLINETTENPVTFEPFAYKTWHHKFPLNEIQEFLEKQSFTLSALINSMHNAFGCSNKKEMLLDSLAKIIKEKNIKEASEDDIKIQAILLAKKCSFWLKVKVNKNFKEESNKSLSQRLIVEESSQDFNEKEILKSIESK